MSRLTLGPTQLPISWLPAVLYPRVNGPVPEAGHLTSVLIAEVRNEWSYTATPYLSLYCRALGQILLVLSMFLSLFSGISLLRSAGRIKLVSGLSGRNFVSKTETK